MSGVRGLQPDEEQFLLMLAAYPACNPIAPRQGRPLGSSQVELMFRLQTQGRLRIDDCPCCSYTTAFEVWNVRHPALTPAGREALKLAAILRVGV